MTLQQRNIGQDASKPPENRLVRALANPEIDKRQSFCPGPAPSAGHGMSSRLMGSSEQVIREHFAAKSATEGL
ncbi:unnamed protein product [Cylicostephanus goldi]|uniref:Uncharacterized protein n=1 Tax=Cylicostephanus goldi TaxID=71465 RepID=A0A3P6PZP0_CYLGO|nr:unnamed protein product [Cylicostephanus goldi]